MGLHNHRSSNRLSDSPFGWEHDNTSIYVFLREEYPLRISNVTTLQVLDLHGNLLEGQVPAAISSLRSLQYLNLGNKLPGRILYLCIRNLVVCFLVEQ
jgi:Leucine-rich repeat (LRR) protein